MSDVRYKLIEGFPGYRVGDDGSVWTCRPINGKGPLKSEWRKLVPVKHRDGHLRVTLRPAHKNVWIHHLVLNAFVGPRPEGMEACHAPDRNPENNKLENLRWDTRSSNVLDAVRDGTHVVKRGINHHFAKVDEEVVRKIRDDADTLAPFKWMADRYGLSIAQIRRIVKRKSWSHVI